MVYKLNTIYLVSRYHYYSLQHKVMIMEKLVTPVDSIKPIFVEKERAQQIIQLMLDIPTLITEAGLSCDYAIDESLAKVGALFAASRVYVMLDEKESRYLRNTHEWVSDKIGSLMFSWPLYDYEYDLPSLKGMLENKEILYGHTKDFPEDIRKVLSKQNVLTTIIAPLYRDKTRIGLVGMDICDQEREWEDAFGVVLRFLATQVSLIIERKQSQTMRGKLSNIMRTLSDTETLLVGHTDQEPSEAHQAKPVTLLDSERRIIIETLEIYNGNKLKTAKHLGLTWPSLDRRCKKLGIEVKRK